MTDDPSTQNAATTTSWGAANPRSGMGRCSVTGKWVSEDELVTFQDQLVCAEGKQILLDRLQMGVAVADQLTRPGVFRRFLCMILDALIMGVVTFVINAIFIICVRLVLPWVRPKFTSLVIRDLISAASITSILIFAMTPIAYLLILHGRSGQTIGKMAGHLRVVNLDDSKIVWRGAFVRALAYSGGLLIFPLVAFIVIISGSNNEVINAIAGIAVLAMPLWSLLDIIFALADTRMQRSLHDRICGTRVIWEHS